MCFEVAKTLNLISLDYSPIPVAFLVSTHTNTFHRAGSGTRLSKVFQFLAQFWLQSVNIDPEIPPCEDLVAGLETSLSLVADLSGHGHSFVEAQGYCHREKEPLSWWFLIYYG